MVSVTSLQVTRDSRDPKSLTDLSDAPNSPETRPAAEVGPGGGGALRDGEHSPRAAEFRSRGQRGLSQNKCGPPETSVRTGLKLTLKEKCTPLRLAGTIMLK